MIQQINPNILTTGTHSLVTTLYWYRKEKYNFNLSTKTGSNFCSFRFPPRLVTRMFDIFPKAVFCFYGNENRLANILHWASASKKVICCFLIILPYYKIINSNPEVFYKNYAFSGIFLVMLFWLVNWRVFQLISFMYINSCNITKKPKWLKIMLKGCMKDINNLFSLSL